MHDSHSTFSHNFYDRFEDAVHVVDGPHPEQAVQLLEDLMVDASEFTSADDETAIQLRMYLGSALWRSGLSPRAVSILELALSDAIRALGWESRVTFSCAGNLCRALNAVGRDEEALQLAQMTYEKRMAAFGEFDNGTLNSLGHLAHLHFDAGNIGQGISLMSSLYEKRYQEFGEHDSRTRSSKYNLTVMMARRDNNEQDLLDLLVECTKEYGAEDPRTIGVWEHVAALFERSGQLEEALETWREAELLNSQVFGEIALPTLTATRRRLQVQRALGDDEAEELLAVVERTIALITGQDVA